MNNFIPASRLIAHRGYSQRYPENTLIGLASALKAGAQHIEFDVQFSADGVPVLFHDSDLNRVTGSPGKIQETAFPALSRLHASEAARFGEKFLLEPIPSLRDVLVLLEEWPHATAYVEIKTETVKSFGVKHVVQVLMKELVNVQAQCVLISFDDDVLACARKAGMQRIGWVVSDWNKASHRQAQSLAPDFLFTDVGKVADGEMLWPGEWQWAVYDVVDADVALQWFERGADLIETWDVGGMLADPRFKLGRLSE